MLPEILLGLYLLSIPGPAIKSVQEVREDLKNEKRYTTRGSLINSIFVSIGATFIPVFNTIISCFLLNDLWHLKFSERWEDWMNKPVGAYAKKQNEKALAK